MPKSTSIKLDEEEAVLLCYVIKQHMIGIEKWLAKKAKKNQIIEPSDMLDDLKALHDRIGGIIPWH